MQNLLEIICIYAIFVIYLYRQTKQKDKTMAQTRKYYIAGCGSGLYVWDNEGNKVFHGTFRACRSELYRLMGWQEPRRKF